MNPIADSISKFGLALLVVYISCSSQKKLSKNIDPSLSQSINKKFDEGVAQYKVMMKNLPPEGFPKTYDPKADKFVTSGSEWWCSGFYPGTLVYLYEQTKDQETYAEAMRILKVLEKEKDNKTTHDLGFMMYCSFGNANRIKSKPEYNEILLVQTS